MPHVRPWTHPPNYAGATWEGWHSSGFGQSRDSDALERSNFRTAWKRIWAAGNPELEDGVQIVREGHFLVGWVEWIAIPSGDEAALAVARELCAKMDGYPILSEDDFGEEELKEAAEVWASCYGVAERVKFIRKHRSGFEFRDMADLMGCVRGKWFAGDPGTLLG